MKDFHRTLLVILTSFLFVLNASSQDYRKVTDSLEKALKVTEDPDARLKILSDVFKNTLFNDLEKAYEYVVRFEEEAIAYGDSSELARSKNFFGMHASTAGDHFRAIDAY
jgi:hypothetical protein